MRHKYNLFASASCAHQWFLWSDRFEVTIHFSRAGFQIADVDNNRRAVFFGSKGDTRWTLDRLRSEIPATLNTRSIRDRAAMLNLLAESRPSVIIHTAAQPSHDSAASIPFDDFDANAVGTLNLLESHPPLLSEVAFHPQVDRST
jgi:CDP-paratose 2-epimerase